MAQFLFIILWVMVTTANGKETEDFVPGIIARNTKKEQNVINMKELGVFDTGYPYDYPPLERMLNEEPDSRETIGTVFQFYRSANKKFTMYFSNMNFSEYINEYYICKKCKTYFLIHDYDGRNSNWMFRLKNALFNKGQCNTFIVNWNTDNRQPYEKAVANIRVVGAEVGYFMQSLIVMGFIKPRHLHVIGHGLGAHASGYAGKWFRDRQQKLIGRITGLDPAGPFFNGVKNDVRLDKSDAFFVDVIHTNTDGQRLKGYGLKEPIGHFDFYPNGGEIQPGCSTELTTYAQNATDVLRYMNSVAIIKKFSRTKDTRSTVVENISDLSCSHARAYEYFIASLEETNCKFVSSICHSWNAYNNGGCVSCDIIPCVRMGFYAEEDGRAIKSERSLKLYVITENSPNFCKANLLNELSDKFVLNKYKIEHLNKRV